MASLIRPRDRRAGRWSFDLRSESEAATFRATLWQLQVNEGVVVDYSTFEKAERAGFPPGCRARPATDDPACTTTARTA